MDFYRGLRECVSLLRANGHPSASRYPLAYLWNEAVFARDRINGILKTHAVLMQAVSVDALAGGHHLQDLMEKINGG